MVYEIQLAPVREKEEKLQNMVDYIHEWLETSKQYRTDCCVNVREKLSRYTCLVCGRRYGNYFMTSAMLVKVFYVTNAFIQFFILNNFLGTDFALFGFEIVRGLVSNDADNLKPSPRFPRVTLCDFQIRQLQNVQKWTVQCVLPINLFNEKIFLFIWFWLVMLCLLSSLSLCTNFYAIMVPIKRVQYIKKYLKLRRVYNSRRDEKKTVIRFVNSYLKFDGFYVIRVAAHNGTEILVSQIIEKLYAKYKSTYMFLKQPNGEPLTTEHQQHNREPFTSEYQQHNREPFIPEYQQHNREPYTPEYQQHNREPFTHEY